MSAPTGLEPSPASARPATVPSGDGDAAGRPLAIEMVLPTLYAAGMETVVVDLARALVARGHRVGVTCLEASGALADVLAASRIRVSVVPAPGLRANLGAPALVRHFADVAPDVVHAHSGAWAKAALSARRAGVPGVVHTVHGLFEREPWHGPPLKRWAARFTDTVVVVSEPLRRYCVDVVGIDARRVELVLNGIDTDRFAPGPRSGAMRGPLGIADDAFVVGTVARLAPVKNQVLLVDAFAALHQQHPRARLVIVGEGELRDALEARIRAHGLEGAAFLPGASSAVEGVYRDFDAFVLCSVAEGTSISMLEAMATGVPTVATAVGGSPAVLDDGAAGTLVPSEDCDALAGALARLAGDDALARRHGDAGRARVLATYARTPMVEAYERLYRLACARRAAPRRTS